MKKYIIILLMTAASLSASARSNSRVDTLQVTTTPLMHCANCENKIKKNIRFVKGVKVIKTSLSEQMVTIIYQNDKANYNDFVNAFDRIGYKIERKTQKYSSKKK
ncbi:MAG: heavy-metal-associated domain-containing protein [Muribaculaceae bacterium]